MICMLVALRVFSAFRKLTSKAMSCKAQQPELSKYEGFHMFPHMQTAEAFEALATYNMCSSRSVFQVSARKHSKQV